jgi:hypothetical protein
VFVRRAQVAICVLLALAIGVWPEEDSSTLSAKQHRIPFKCHDGLIYMAAVVNGHHVTVLLDTGAGTTAFKTKIAPPIHGDAVTTIDLAKGSMLAFHLPVEFTLGEPTQKDRSYSFNKVVLVGNFTFNEAEGVVGLDVLRSFKVATIDFKNSVLVLEDH